MKTCLGVLVQAFCDAGNHSYAYADVKCISVLCFLVIHYILYQLLLILGISPGRNINN